MGSHRRALLQRALATGGAVVMAGTAVLLGAGPAGAHAADDCRAYSPYTAHPFVKIVAQDNAFDTDCLKAPPDRYV